MATEVMKMEVENETCCVCGGDDDLQSPEEHDAGAPMPVPLRTMLLTLNSCKVVPDGRLCANCIRRTIEAYEFSSALNNKTTPPLSEKIRALRKRSPPARRGPQRSHVTYAQLDALHTLLSANRAVAMGFNKSLSDRERARLVWLRVARALNRLDGSSRTWKAWSKYWADYKSKLKKRIKMARAAQRRGEGDGDPEFNTLELRFLSIMNLTEDAVGDDPLLQVPANIRTYDSEEELPSPVSNPVNPIPVPVPVPVLVPEPEPVSVPEPEPSSTRAPEIRLQLSTTAMEDAGGRRGRGDSGSDDEDDDDEDDDDDDDDDDVARARVPRRPRLLTEAQTRSSLVRSIRLKAQVARRNSRSIRRAVAALEGIQQSLRRIEARLHELTQKIDVFIVVGGAGGAGGAAYSEEDIILVERDALAAAAAADAAELGKLRNARGDDVYQCSVCPHSFQRVAEYRAHVATHPADAMHSCWTCGAQFATRAALQAHGGAHADAALACQLCGRAAASAAELRRHEAACPPRCSVCSELFPDREALATHAAQAHGRDARGPHVCPACFRACDTPELLSAHLLRHRQARQFVCGYDACILRFVTRSNLIAHIRKCHAGDEGSAGAGAGAEEPGDASTPVRCHSCPRTFGSVPAMKRHARVHRAPSPPAHEQQLEEWAEELEGEVEYLEVEVLDEAEQKPHLADLL